MLAAPPVKLYVEKAEYDSIKMQYDQLLETLGFIQEQLKLAWTEEQVAQWIESNIGVIPSQVHNIRPLLREAQRGLDREKPVYAVLQETP